MIEVFYGLNSVSIHNEIEKIKKQIKVDDFSIRIYNLSETSLKEIIEDSNTFSFFDDQKLIVVYESDFLTGKGTLPIDLVLLEEYIQSPNEKTRLIFVTLEEKLDERKKIVKELKKNAHIKEFKNNDPISFIKDEFDDYQIDSQTIRFLIDRCGSDFVYLHSEIEKLKLYKMKEKTITKEDIENVTVRVVSLDTFEFIDDILYQRKKKALETYNELLKRGTEPLAIITMLAGQIRIMYQSKELSKKRYSESDIAKILNIHPYRVKKALEKGYRYDGKLLLSYLEKLALLDIEIKKGLKNKDLALELFILEVHA